MDEEMEKTIERFLQATDEDDFDPICLGLEFEKGEDSSFDTVLRKLDDPTTSDMGRIRGLQMMALTTRHFCVHRMPEVIDLLIRSMEHPNLRVRSSAVNMATAGTSAMLGYGAFKDTAAATLERVKKAVAGAIQRGLEPETEELAHRFIAWDGQTRVPMEEE
jgi:hypothetical protein